MKVQGPHIPSQLPNNQTQDKPEVVCPVIRGMVNEGHLKVDAEGNAKISELQGIFEDIGISRKAAYVAAAGNGVGDIFGNLFSGTFNVNDLRGGLLDHSGDSMILRNGKFDAQKFEDLVSHSTDGKNMTMADFQKAIADNKKVDNASWLGSKISNVEFTILLEGFGTKGADGTQSISVEDLRNLYEHKQIPPNFRPETRVQADNAVAGMSSLARSLPSNSQVGLAKSGADSALKQSDMFSSAGIATKGMGQGICPHMGSAGEQTTPASQAEVTQLHNQLPDISPDSNSPNISAE